LIISVMLMTGCVSLPKVERMVDDNGRYYNLETVEYRETKEWGIVTTYAMTLALLWIQLER